MQSLWILVSSFLFSLMSVFIKMSSDDFGTCEMIFYRSLVSVILLYAFVRWRGYSLRTDYLFGHFKRSLAGTVSMFFGFWSLTVLSVGTSMTLCYTNPLFMALFVVAFAFYMRQPIPWKLISMIALGFTGIVIILQPSFTGDDQFLGALAALFSAFLAAVAYWQIKELGQLREPSWRIVFYFALFGVFFGLTGCFAFEGGFSEMRMDNISPLIGICVTALLAQCCLTRAFGSGNVLLTSCLQFSAIIFAEIFSVIFFGEVVSSLSMIGMAIIMVAGVSSTVITKNMERKVKQS